MNLLLLNLLLACCSRADLLLGGDTAQGLSLQRWNFTANASTPLGPALPGLQTSPNLAASLLLADGTWVLAPYETATTDRLIQFSVRGGAPSGTAVELGPEERCFLLYRVATDPSGELRCLSEVDDGTRTTTALRSIDRTSGAKRLLATVLPYFSPCGPAAHDAAGSAVRVLYFYSPPARSHAKLVQGTYLVTLNDATAAPVSTTLVAAPGLRVLQIAQGGGRTFAIAVVGSGAVYAGTLDAATAAFSPLPASPDFSRSFTSTRTTAAALGGGALWFSLGKESLRPAADGGGPPVYTPWLLGVDNTTGALVYEADASDGDLVFAYLQWSS